MTVQEAIDLLHRERHALAPDAIRSLADTWMCASAARYGEPCETWMTEDSGFYRDHDITECETGGDVACDACGREPFACGCWRLDASVRATTAETTDSGLEN